MGAPGVATAGQKLLECPSRCSGLSWTWRGLSPRDAVPVPVGPFIQRLAGEDCRASWRRGVWGGSHPWPRAAQHTCSRGPSLENVAQLCLRPPRPKPSERRTNVRPSQGCGQLWVGPPPQLLSNEGVCSPRSCLCAAAAGGRRGSEGTPEKWGGSAALEDSRMLVLDLSSHTKASAVLLPVVRPGLRDTLGPLGAPPPGGPPLPHGLQHSTVPRPPGRTSPWGAPRPPPLRALAPASPAPSGAHPALGVSLPPVPVPALGRLVSCLLSARRPGPALPQGLPLLRPDGSSPHDEPAVPLPPPCPACRRGGQNPLLSGAVQGRWRQPCRGQSGESLQVWLPLVTASIPGRTRPWAE